MTLNKALLLGLLCIATSSNAQIKKSVAAVKTATPPTIDGIIEDAVWEQTPLATEFYNLEPQSGGRAKFITEVRFLYDDVALYIAADMLDPNPQSIPTQLGKRDDDDVVADWFGLWINPFNDGANELNFRVTAAGVQVDMKASPHGEDDSWNPVWSSDYTIHNQGWSVEIAVPFSQMRFPAKDIQIWGLNMARYRALDREVYTWIDLDKAKDFAQQVGRLTGMENLETPLRLSLIPYASASLEHYPFDEPGKSNISKIVRGGIDLKYGINESFTLDMTLIPDFGQVQSDNEVLNLSPFEIQHNEHRPFFNEGTQLLHKAGLFYSRRVGSTPQRYWDVEAEDFLATGETLVSNPDVTQLINASKVTGQTVNGIGLGFFNALTSPVHAVVRDSLGNEREHLTNPLTNYNLVVVSKNLNNGSEFSVVNTNVQRFAGDDTTDDFRDANVIGYDTRLLTKDYRWVFESNAAYNSLYYPDSVSTGYKYYLGISEEQGALLYGIGHSVESEYFNPNDLGFLRQANENEQFVWARVRTLDPVWKVNNASIRIRASYASLYHPRKYTSTNLNGNYDVTFKNYYSIGGGFYIRPKEAHDYSEPRVDGRYFTVPTAFDSHVWVASNYNKSFSASGWIGTSSTTRRGSKWLGGGFNPRWRVNNQFMIQYELDAHSNTNGHGFADFDTLDNPVFGRRDQVTITNTIYSSFIFSPSLESDIRIRHYRSALEYEAFFDLLEDGNLSPRDFDGELNTVYNAFTIDAVLTWRFAPGSELNVTWKNAIQAEGDDPGISYLDDLSELPSLDQSNSISLKLLYYVDAWDLKHRFR